MLSHVIHQKFRPGSGLVVKFVRAARLLAVGLLIMSPGKAADEAAAPKVLDERSPSLLTWEKGPEAREFRAGHAAFLSKVKAGEHLAFKIPWLDIAFVFVPPGAFTMGDENGEEDELPETPMKITRGFWLGKFELSQEEWQLVMRSNLSRHKSPQRPVEMISWRGAVDFCKRLTERERQAGRLPRGYVYRLPTEAEWEYACRVGVEGRTPGVTPNTGWYAANAHQKTQPVGEKEANGLGVYDMFGNVAEWCYDWYGRYPGKPCNDYTGPSVGDFRVTRGGCSFDIAYGCRPAYRTGAEPISRSEGIGMRLALGPELPE